MPRGRGQNDAAVKSHRRCSERHKEDAKAACPRLLCANTKYTIASLVSNDEKAKVVVLLLRASCDDDGGIAHRPLPNTIDGCNADVVFGANPQSA